MILERWSLTWSTWDMIVTSCARELEVDANARYMELLAEGRKDGKIRTIRMFYTAGPGAETNELFSTHFIRR